MNAAPDDFVQNLRIPDSLLPADGRFGCGPSRIRPEAMAGLAAPTSILGTSHRQDPVIQVVAELRAGLTELYHAPDGYQVALGDGGATLFWDAAACCLVRNRAACGVFGAFSNKFAVELQQSPFLADPAIFSAEPGSVCLPTAVADVDAYCWPHNETSTGARVPVERPEGIDEDDLVLVDGTSAAGAIPVDVSQTDAYYFSAQKNLAADGGMWLAFLSPAAIERIGELSASARWVPGILNLQKALDNSVKDQTFNTPSLSALQMARDQVSWVLDKGGMDWVAARTARSSQLLYSWASDRPWARPFVEDPQYRSPVTVTIDFDEAIDATVLCKVARANGIVDIDGYHKLGRNQIRVGTFASVDPDDVEALAACLDWIVERIADESELGGAH